MRTPLLNIGLATLALSFLCACNGGKPQTAVQLVKEVRESIVRIQIVGIGNRSESDLAADPTCQNAPDSGGTGFVVSPEGHILTNNHVVETWARCRGAWPNVPLRVLLFNGETNNAELVGTDPATDLAVLKINKKGLRPLQFADFDKTEIGEEVVAIGYPRPGQIEGAPTVTKGIVSAKDRAIDRLGDLIQTDATINGGNSGGPLLSLSGQVVGVNTLRLASNGNIEQNADGSFSVNVDVSEGTNFAVSSRIASRVSSDLISNGKVQRAGLGIIRGDAITETGALILGLQGQPFSVGILIGEVAPGSPATQVLEKCDVLERLGNYRIANIGDLNNALIWHRSGETVKIQYRRYPPDKCNAVPPEPFFQLPRVPDPVLDFSQRMRRGEIALNIRRGRVLAAHRDEGKVLTADVTLAADR